MCVLKEGEQMTISRRDFLEVSALSASAVMLAKLLPGEDATLEVEESGFSPDRVASCLAH